MHVVSNESIILIISTDPIEENMENILEPKISNLSFEDDIIFRGNIPKEMKICF